MANFRDKTKTLKELASLVNDFRKRGKKIVLSHGVFDLLHPGHMFYLNESKSMGDVLIVSVVVDEFVRKGPNRPHYDQNMRINSVANIECVDFVIACVDFGPWEIIESLKPEIYARASDVEHLLEDPDSGLSKDRKILDSVGGQLKFVDEIPGMHSTRILNQYFNIFPSETMSFLRDFRKKYSASDIVMRLEGLSDMRVLVIGETIIDEYCYVSTMGKASKANIISSKFLKSEEYAGGILACANHLAGICSKVNLVTYLGGQDTKEEFVRAHLKSGVASRFFYCPDEPTIVKRRFIDNDYFNKLFEIYYFEERPLASDVEEKIANHLDQTVADYDLVVVVDYGHGFLTPRLIDIITEKSKFLAVNAQTNSANKGFNYITKYKRMDYVCVDEIEARLAMHDETTDIRDLIDPLSQSLFTEKLVITLGREGTIVLGDDKSVREIPSFAHRITDPVGAGDAFIAISAPCAAAGFPIEIVTFIGSIAGSIATGILGNKFSVEREELFRYVGYLLE